MENSPDRTDLSTEDLLRQVVVDVIDTVATFDGRFAYTPMSPEGACVLIFSGLNKKVELTVHAKVLDNHQVTVLLTVASSGGVNETDLVYQGAFNQTQIRYRLGDGLANWYGRLVRR